MYRYDLDILSEDFNFWDMYYFVYTWYGLLHHHLQNLEVMRNFMYKIFIYVCKSTAKSNFFIWESLTTYE